VIEPDSDQCAKHGKKVFKDGANQVWKKFKKPGNKYRVTYGDIKDHMLSVSAPSTLLPKPSPRA
jgi:hypothetical protein